MLLEKNAEKIARIGLIANFEKSSSRAVVRGGRATDFPRRARRGRGRANRAHGRLEVRHLCRARPRWPRKPICSWSSAGTAPCCASCVKSTAPDTPILGINIGRLGFLTAVSSTDLAAALEKLWRNEFVIESRPLIEASGQCRGKPIRMSALNDIVISRGAVSRLIELEVSVNDKPLTSLPRRRPDRQFPDRFDRLFALCRRADYQSGSGVFAITPICAHALSNRRGHHQPEFGRAGQVASARKWRPLSRPTARFRPIWPRATR